MADTSIWSFLGPLIGSGLNIGGAEIASKAAQNAAQIQANAALQSAQMLYGLGQQQLGFQQQQWAQTQQNAMPFLALGRGAANLMGSLMGIKPDYPSQAAAPTMASLYQPQLGQLQPLTSTSSGMSPLTAGALGALAGYLGGKTGSGSTFDPIQLGKSLWNLMHGGNKPVGNQNPDAFVGPDNPNPDFMGPVWNFNDWTQFTGTPNPETSGGGAGSIDPSLFSSGTYVDPMQQYTDWYNSLGGDASNQDWTSGVGGDTSGDTSGE